MVNFSLRNSNGNKVKRTIPSRDSDILPTQQTGKNMRSDVKINTSDVKSKMLKSKLLLAFKLVLKLVAQSFKYKSHDECSVGLTVLAFST